MKKHLFTIIIFLFFALAAAAQQSVKEMKRKAGDLQKQIAAKENIYLSSQKDVKSKMQDLELLSAQIKERRQLVGVLQKELQMLDAEIAKIDKEVRKNEESVDKSRGEYAQALRRARRYGTFREKLLFVVSAEDFNTMLRRYRYTREYMNAHRTVAERLKSYIAELEFKRAQADSVRTDKAASLQMQNEQKTALEALEGEQRNLLAELRRESKKVERELNKQRKQLAKLNSDIERAIEREIEAQKARERAAAHERAQREKAKKGSGKSAPSSTKQADGLRMNTEEVARMSGSFEQNKGKLPVPITGPYHLVGSFGRQKGVVGKGNIQIDYGGVTLQGAKGAQARCVFDGTVTSVVRSDDFAFVIVRHGSYLTVYCRLSNICVKQGDRVKAGDILADIATDASGHTRILFQLRKEKTKLNPSQWLKM